MEIARGKEYPSGYAGAVASLRVQQEVTKAFLGKPYIKYGQCFGVWGYMVQLGGILGAAHSAGLDAFGPAFLGLKGAPGAVGDFFTASAHDVMPTLADSIAFFDYVGTKEAMRLGQSGDWHDLVITRGMEKVGPADAAVQAWRYASEGAALGAVHPDVVRRVFERQTIPKKSWKLAHDIGVNIPPEQDRMSYEEVVAAENEPFMEYCLRYCPSYHSILGRAQNRKGGVTSRSR